MLGPGLHMKKNMRVPPLGLDPDQMRQNVGADLIPNYLTLRWCSGVPDFFFEKVEFKKKSADDNIT